MAVRTPIIRRKPCRPPPERKSKKKGRLNGTEAQLVPLSLLNSHPDGEELKDKKINTVSFSGGGAMMTYAVSRSSHKTSISRVGYNDQFRHVTSSEINVGVMAVSSSAKVSLGAQDYLRNSETQQEHTDEQSSTVTFHFGDPDIGDYFDVAVYEDPYFPGGKPRGFGGWTRSMSWDVDISLLYVLFLCWSDVVK